MIRRHAGWSVLLGSVLAVLAAPASAHTRTYFGFQIGIGNAPPPPVVVFRDAPEVVLVPRTRVYVVEDDDYDMFRYGSHYYVVDNGYWYRSRSYRGPFRVVDVRRVPRAVFYVPQRHWKHHHWRDDDRAYVVKGKGKAKGHGHKSKHKRGDWD